MQGINQANWDYTNYENQRKHMENAGLNVGLMYGSSGGGGGTLGGSSGGSAAGGNAPKTDYATPTQGILGLGLQNKAIESQIKVNEAQADKLSAEAIKTKGVDTQLTTTQVESLAQGINNQKAQEALTKMQTELSGVEYDLKNSTLEEQKNITKQSLKQLERENYILKNQGLITDVEAKNISEKTKLQLIQMNLDNILKQSQNANTQANTEKIKEETSIIFKDYLARAKNANTGELRMMNEQTNQEFQRKLSKIGLDLQEQQQIISILNTVISSGASAGASMSNANQYNR